MENLDYRRVHIKENTYVMSGKSNKKSCHFFLVCKLTLQGWNKCNIWIRVSEMQLNLTKSHFHQFSIIELNYFGNRI